jgi:hypothetical protein
VRSQLTKASNAPHVFKDPVEQLVLKNAHAKLQEVFTGALGFRPHTADLGGYCLCILSHSMHWPQAQPACVHIPADLACIGVHLQLPPTRTRARCCSTS